ncbi:MAG: DUF4258 domain-containing protein [Ginsengibacter sp.]
MKRKTNFYFLIILVIVFLIIKGISFYNTENRSHESFRDYSHLILTKHVKCRMNCRQITEDEIKEVLQNGKINYSKSGIGSKGDSTFALEGFSHEKQHIRIVVAPENGSLILITCIDLDKEWPCNCY